MDASTCVNLLPCKRSSPARLLRNRSRFRHKGEKGHRCTINLLLSVGTCSGSHCIEGKDVVLFSYCIPSGLLDGGGSAVPDEVRPGAVKPGSQACHLEHDMSSDADNERDRSAWTLLGDIGKLVHESDFDIGHLAKSLADPVRIAGRQRDSIQRGSRRVAYVVSRRS